jgi:hypothetical protein
VSSTANMQKPPIAVKPKITQKTNVVIVGTESSSKNGKKEQCMENLPLVSKDANHFTSLPSSPPNFSDCANDCFGILHNKQLECIQRQKNNKNGSYSNGASTDEENDSDFKPNEKIDHKTFVEQLFKTSSQSFDSSSSSSGGFKDFDYVTKTKVAYETYDKGEQPNDHEAPSYQMPIGNSKVQEMKLKLLAQQKQHQQNHTSNEPSIVINRQNVQKSSRELEKVLRIDKNVQLKADKSVKRLSKSFDDGHESVAAISSQIGANISKQIQQKLTEEMKQQCEMIKEKFLIEKVPVQQHYSDYTVEKQARASNRCLFPLLFNFAFSFRFHRLKFFIFYFILRHCLNQFSFFPLFFHPITE